MLLAYGSNTVHTGLQRHDPRTKGRKGRGRPRGGSLTKAETANLSKLKFNNIGANFLIAKVTAAPRAKDDIPHRL